MRIPFLGPDKKDAKKPAAKTTSAKTTSAKKKAAKKKVPKENPPPPPKAPAHVGKTSGVTVNETWIQVFEKNEQVEASKRLTDEQISQFMKSEFPDLDTKLFDRVQIARGKYNRGGFHKKDKSGNVVRPKVHSQPHTSESGQGAAAGRKLHPKEGDAAPKRGPVGKYHKDFKSTKK
jgi:hypothetical protein